MQTFNLSVNGQDITLKWGTYGMKLYCESEKKTIDEFFDSIERFGTGTLDSEQKMNEYYAFVAGVLKAGYKYQNKTDIDDQTVCEWIDRFGGLTGITRGQIMDYVNFVITLTLSGVTPLNEAKEEKKSEQT